MTKTRLSLERWTGNCIVKEFLGKKLNLLKGHKFIQCRRQSNKGQNSQRLWEEVSLNEVRNCISAWKNRFCAVCEEDRLSSLLFGTEIFDMQFLNFHCDKTIQS